MAKHLEIAVEASPVWGEFVSNILIEKAGCAGIVSEEKDFKDEELVQSSNGTVKGYIWFDKNQADNTNHEEIISIIKQERKALINNGINPDSIGSWDVSFKEIADEDWAHNWKKYWHVQKIGEKIVVCPSWEEYTPKQTDIVISLDPGTAFGAGNHPTSRLCIKALEKYVSGNETLADIGTGSGILAIAASKLGIKSGLGVDNDASVIDIAKENARKNNVDNLIFYEGSTQDIKDTYDLVTVNILARIIIQILPEIYAVCAQGGITILSGIIKKQEADVVKAATEVGFNLLEILEQDDWVSIILRKGDH